MSVLDELFASAKRNGIGVLVINDLHIGDRTTADQIVYGDVNTTTTLVIPREALQGNQRPAIGGASFGDSGPCVPLADELIGHTLNWRGDDIEQRRSQFEAKYARQCDEAWRQ